MSHIQIPHAERLVMKICSLSQQFIRLGRDQRGVSAVEFAMVLPLMMTMYLGTVEISQGIAIDRKVTLITRTVADLASQVSKINTAQDMQSILNASAQVVMPYDSTPLKVTVSEVQIDTNSNATIVWSCTLNGNKESGSVTVPSALLVPNTWLIWSEVSYSYKPAVGYVVTGTLNLSDRIYMRPRLSASVPFNGTC
jgi:Flp pilus assembly protein TadG